MSIVFLCSFLILANNSNNILMKEEFTAKGVKEIEFNLKTWGRVSFQVESPEGVQLQLMDKKQGIRRTEGVAGEVNGRIDEYLDVGPYKVFAHADFEGKSKATVLAYGYKELNKPEYMTKDKSYETVLNDLQQRSYWIYLEKDTTFFIEAVGRSLSDIQIWKDGEWRVDLSKSTIKAMQETDTPLKGWRVVQNLKSGYYLVTLYGGEALQWTKESDKSPLYFKWGLERLSANSCRSDVISKQGYNEYIVKSQFTSAILSASTTEKMLLEVIPYNNSSSFSMGRSQSIHSKLIEPRIMVGSGGNSNSIIRVTGTPGKTFNLKTLNKIDRYYPDGRGQFWISSIHSNVDKHQFGVSTFLVENHKDNKIIFMATDSVSSKKRIKREFNLLNEINCYVWVEESGTYVINPVDEKFNIKIGRCFTDGTPFNSVTVNKKMKVGLRKGLHNLLIYPKEKGVVNLEFYNTSIVGAISGMVFGKKEEKLSSQLQYMQIPSMYLDKIDYKLYVNNLNPEISSVVFRKLPMNLEDPLMVKTESGKKIPVKIKVEKESRLYVTDNKGVNKKFYIGNKEYSSPYQIQKGTYDLAISGKGEYQFAKTRSVESLPGSKAKTFPTGEDSPLPKFPIITENDPDYFNLKRSDYAVYNVEVKNAGIYNFTTTGRLHTELKLRDRFTTSLFREDANGIGRNALINTYLLPGTYQAVVSTQGRSAGRLGLHLDKGNMVDGGELTLNREKRFKVPAGDGLSYSLNIENDGEYNIVSYWQNGDFAIRLDDADGWPMVKPGTEGAVNTTLKGGKYSLKSLPTKQTRLRIAKLVKQKQSKEYAGYGPHTLKINKPIASIWNEDSTKVTNKPVIFHFDNPVKLPYKISVTDRFTALFINKERKDTVVVKGNSEKNIDRGFYEIHLSADEEKRYEPYQLSVATGVLTPGDAFSIYPQNKESIKVAVGKSSVIELFSEGKLDVSGTLTDSKGNLIAYNDDNTMDWNFTISQLLHPGIYNLMVEPQVANSRQITIGMTALKDSVHSGWGHGKTVKMDLARKIHTIPIKTENSSIISIVVEGRSKVGAYLEKIENDKYSMVGHEEGEQVSLSAPVMSGANYYLHIWSVDHIYEDITVSIIKSKPETITYNMLAQGATPKLIANGSLNFGWYKVDMGNDSVCRFEFNSNDNISHIKTASSINKKFNKVIDSQIQTYNRWFWLEVASGESRKKEVSTSVVMAPEKKVFGIDNNPVTYKVKSDGKSLNVITTEMKPGMPVSGIIGKNGQANVFPAGIPVQYGAFTPDKKAISVILPERRSTIVLWNGDSKSQHQNPTTMVSTRKYSVVDKGKLSTGFTSIEATPWEATSWSVDFNSYASITVNVPERTICVWEDESGKQDVLSAFDKFSRFTFTAKKGNLYFINNSKSTVFSVNSLLYDYTFKNEPFAFSDVSSNYSFKSSQKGIRKIPVKNYGEKSEVTLFYSDDITDVTWYRGDGTVISSLRNRDVLKVEDNDKNGFLLISYNPGDHTVLLCEDNMHSCFWGEELDGKTDMRITEPAMLSLNKEISWAVYKTSKMQQITFKSEDVVAAVIMKDGKAIESFNSSYGISGTAPLAPGEYKIGFKLNKNSGNIAVTFMDMLAIKEGEENQLQLASGETRFMYFELSERNKIGIGIPTDDEVFDIELFNNNLEKIVTGKQVFTVLDKGIWYIGLSIPFRHNAATCTVNLIGQNPAPDQVPQETKNYFLQFKED